MEYVEKIAEEISTISVSGSGMLLDQLKQLFVSGNGVKKNKYNNRLPVTFQDR